MQVTILLQKSGIKAERNVVSSINLNAQRL
jgi:hypothetical protein